MRITISHTRPKEQVMRSIDKSFNDLFKGVGIVPMQFLDERRTWNESTLTFSVSAKMGVLSLPLAGTIEVTDKDVIMDVDLGLLERLLSARKVHDAIGSRIRGLLT